MNSVHYINYPCLCNLQWLKIKEQLLNIYVFEEDVAEVEFIFSVPKPSLEYILRNDVANYYVLLFYGLMQNSVKSNNRNDELYKNNENKIYFRKA